METEQKSQQAIKKEKHKEGKSKEASWQKKVSK